MTWRWICRRGSRRRSCSRSWSCRPASWTPARSCRFASIAQTTSARELTDWLETAINDEIAQRRFLAAGIDQALVKKLTARTDITSFGLVERGADGAAVPAKEMDELSKRGRADVRAGR